MVRGILAVIFLLALGGGFWGLVPLACGLALLAVQLRHLSGWTRRQLLIFWARVALGATLGAVLFPLCLSIGMREWVDLDWKRKLSLLFWSALVVGLPYGLTGSLVRLLERSRTQVGPCPRKWWRSSGRVSLVR